MEERLEIERGRLLVHTDTLGTGEINITVLPPPTRVAEGADLHLVPKHILDPATGIIGVAVKVVEMVLDGLFTWSGGRTHGISAVAVRPQHAGELVQAGHGAREARITARGHGTVQHVVGLVGHLSHIAEEEGRADCKSLAHAHGKYTGRR